MFTKLTILLFAVLASAVAQRPPYAGSRPIGRPELASRFKNTEETTTVSLNDRIGSDGSTIRIPTDARGDVNLVNRLNQWPREHQPFWLINAEHIERQRHPEEPVNNFGTSQQGVQTQSRFGGQDVQYSNQGHNHFGTNDQVNFASRSNFDNFNEVPSRPIRPVASRSSFLGPA